MIYDCESMTFLKFANRDRLEEKEMAQHRCVFGKCTCCGGGTQYKKAVRCGINVNGT